MTTYNTIPSLPVTGGDLSAYNNAGTDIPAGTAVIVDAAFVPSGDFPMGVKIPATAGSIAEPAGVTVEIIKAGQVGRVRRAGSYPATASGTVTVGDFLQVDSAAGKEGRVKTKGAGLAQVGRALNSGVDGDLINTDVILALNA